MDGKQNINFNQKSIKDINSKNSNNINYTEIEEDIDIIQNKILSLNSHFNFYNLIPYFFTDKEEKILSSYYLNNPRFVSIFSRIDHLEYKYLMAYLNYSLDNGNVMNGIKETIRSIEMKKAKLVFVAEDCEIQDYSNLIIKLCEMNQVSYIKVLHWTNLRDILFKGPTSIELENIAKSKGKPAKITPKCNSAVILFTKEELEIIQKGNQNELNKENNDLKMELD